MSIEKVSWAIHVNGFTASDLQTISQSQKPLITGSDHRLVENAKYPKRSSELRSWCSVLPQAPPRYSNVVTLVQVDGRTICPYSLAPGIAW